MRLPPQSAQPARTTRTRVVGIGAAALTQSQDMMLKRRTPSGRGGSDWGNYRCYKECFDECFLHQLMPGWYCDARCRERCG